MQQCQPFTFTATDVAQRFQHRTIFSGLSLSLANGQTLGITGHNGSGKSTLMKILCNVLTPTQGALQLSLHDKEIERDELYRYVGFVSPYMTLYEEFTAMEHAKINADLRCIPFDEEAAVALLALLKLEHRRHDDIKTYSSGMKQRMKYALALLHEPVALLLDEPMTNLDNEGIGTVEHIVAMQTQRGGGVIIATNDERDKTLCHAFVSVE